MARTPSSGRSSRPRPSQGLRNRPPNPASATGDDGDLPREFTRHHALRVEPRFGDAKDWHGLRRFRVRGLWNVNCEGLLIAAGQDLKRRLSRMGWGRQHGPAGSLALSPVPPAISI